jgi:riboflavin biosynthesis pyrimidine reductase
LPRLPSLPIRAARGREPQGKRAQSSLFEQERQQRLRILVDCRIRQELRMNVPLQRQRPGLTVSALEHENQNKAYNVYNTAGRQVQACR